MLENFSLTNESLPYINGCLFFGVSSIIYITIIIGNILICLPLLSFILYCGVQNWLQSPANSSASTTSHLDSFTYNMVIMELLSVCWCFLVLFSVFTLNFKFLEVGSDIVLFTWYGQGFFHILTCVERYLAVVHPVTYLSLRNEKGIRIRNISIGCTWLLSFLIVNFIMVEKLFFIFDWIFLISFFSAITFCCLSVLRVLIRPGPSEQGRDRNKVDKLKQRAFYTIVAILGVLVLKFSWALVWLIAEVSGGNVDCEMMISEFLINLPSSLVLPLLFLHRKGKLVCFRNSIQ